MKCFICDSEAGLFCKKDNFLIYKCGTCGSGFTEGLEIKKGSYHRDEVYIGGRDQFVNIFRRRVELIKKYFKDPGKVLEVGSSIGTMLYIFKKDSWDVRGVEISPKAARYALEHGIPTTYSTIEKADFPEESFDAVIINHTLEHLESPKDVIKKVNSLLKKDGLILIDVPNFGSLSAQMQKNKWLYLLPEEHRWHFTEEGIERLLSDNGFKVIEKFMPSGVFDYGSPMLELWQALKGGKKRFFKDLFMAVPALILTMTGKGTSLTVLARKK